MTPHNQLKALPLMEGWGPFAGIGITSTISSCAGFDI